MHGNLLRAAPIFLVLLVAQAAWAESPGMAELSTAASSDRSVWGLRVIGETAMGAGTLISNEFADDPLVLSSLTLTPIYRLERLPFKPNLSVTQYFQWEYTQPNSIAARRFQWGDTAIALTSNNLYVHEPTGIRIGGSLGASLPISYRSWYTNKITTATASARAMWMGGGFTVMGTLAAAKHFYAYRNEVRESEVRFDDGTQAVHCRSGQEVCMGGRYSMNWSTTAGVMVSYSVMPKLSLTLDMAWTGGWRMAAPVDEFTSPNARTDDRTIDMTRTLLDVSYGLTDKLSLSVGAATMQPLLTSDNKAWRNPFYDGHPRNNFTIFYLDAVYSI